MTRGVFEGRSGEFRYRWMPLFRDPLGTDMDCVLRISGSPYAGDVLCSLGPVLETLNCGARDVDFFGTCDDGHSIDDRSWLPIGGSGKDGCRRLRR